MIGKKEGRGRIYDWRRGGERNEDRERRGEKRINDGAERGGVGKEK